MTSAETRLANLFERLLTAAEASLASGDLEQARATAEEIRAVDPDNVRATEILRLVEARQSAPIGERALVSMLFSDLVGSTMIAERVEPEQLRDLYSTYRGIVTEAVQRYSGSILMYSGDGILAVFGRPTAHEDDTRRAVLAGIDLVSAMHAAAPDMERRVGVAADVRVGIHTGTVVIEDLRGDTSVPDRDSIVGAAPNLAARIQQAAEPGTVVISDVTQQLVDADFILRTLGVRELKGITRPVEVFIVEGPRSPGGRFEAERFRRGGLVGRDEQRRRLNEWWEAVSGGEPGSVHVISGEAGIGKTRLVADLLATVDSSGGRTLTAASLPYYSNVSLWPIGRMLERAAGISDTESDRLGLMESHLDALGLDPTQFVPFLSPLIGLDASANYPVPELDPSAFLDETLNRLVEWLSATARTTPHLLIVEDLHWADPSTVGLLGRLAERHPVGLFTVATTRDDTVLPWLASAELLNLSRLDDATATELVDNVAGGESALDDELRASIVGRAEGIPLFIEELTQSLLDEHRKEPIPLRLRELFTWRLKAPGVDLRVPQVAATLGPTFDASTVSAVIGDDELVTNQLSLLTDHGVVERGDLDEDTYRFRHALLRDAAYETQILDVRSRTHTRVAEVLTAQGAEQALIAEHFDLAGAAHRAIPFYLKAGQAEQGRGAHQEATRLLSRVLHLLNTLPESDDRDLTELTARMLRGLSISSMQGYAAPEVQADHRRAEVLATRLGTRPELLPSLIAIWAYWLTSGDLGSARVLIDRLQAMVRQPAFSWFGPEVESCAGWLEFYQGNLASARAHLERAVKGFAVRPPEESVSPFWPLPNDPIAVSDIALACVSVVQGDTDEGRRWEEAALARAEKIGFPRGPFSLAFVKTYAAWIRRFLGDHDTSRALGAEVVGIGQTYGYIYWMTLGAAYLATGEPGGKPDLAFVENIVTTLRLMGQEAFAASNLAYLAKLESDSGAVDRAVELIDQAIEVVHKTGENLHLAALLRQRALYGLSRGDRASDMVEDLTEAFRVANEQEAHVERLRVAIAMARLPETIRPAQWRDRLEASKRDIPPGSAIDELAEADALITT
jgi:class 3 adenylate cyclase/tetratricopeptide (TPR) repeat protein